MLLSKTFFFTIRLHFLAIEMEMKRKCYYLKFYICIIIFVNFNIITCIVLFLLFLCCCLRYEVSSVIVIMFPLRTKGDILF